MKKIEKSQQESFGDIQYMDLGKLIWEILDLEDEDEEMFGIN